MRQVIGPCALLVLAGCVGGDAPPVIGLAEEQAAQNQTLEGSIGDPADALGADPAGDLPDAETEVAAVEPRGRGLFGLFGGGGGSPDTPEVAPGTALPFAQVATVCGTSPRRLGTEVDEAPSSGRARYRLIDSEPGSTAPRSQYLTGFSDRCARQFTGALVLFGSTSVHETTRYAQGNGRPYTDTDEAYEQIKARICGVRRNVPCPADRRDRLDRELVFVTVYPRFGTSGEWFELLLHDGALKAQALTGS